MSNSTALQYGDSQTERLKSISDGSFAQQKQVLDAVPVGIFVVDAMHRITFFNRKAEQITGIQAHEAIGAKCGTTLKPTHCGPNCPAQRLHKTGQEQLDFVSAFTSTDGALISVRLSVTRTERLGSAVFTFDALRERESAPGEDSSVTTCDRLAAKSPAMRRIFALLPDLAKSQARVLVEGPTGCGKELVARALHNLSRRKRGPFVPINCGAIPDHLFESELFGYARGAFTDAKQDKAGWVAAARGGTLVLDEICDLSLPNQVKLLRLLQEGEYSPLGSTVVAKADIRVVALTNKPLLAAVRAGTFREDLYYRLSVIHVRIPPLRERPDDIPVLLTQMIKRFNQRYGKQVAAVTPNVSAILAGHTFPGNVRELENIIEHAFVVCRGELIDVCHLPMDLQENLRLVGPGKSKLEKAEAQVFAAALMEARGSPKIAAEKLGISRSTFYRHMKRHALSAQAACPFPSDHSG